MSILKDLQSWYLAECDGDWEHSFGIKLETLDNPGWLLTVDLEDTSLEGLHVPRVITEREENDWVQYEVADGRFVASGGGKNLEEVIEAFLKIVKP